MSSVPGPDAGGNERKGHKRKHSETVSIAQEGDAADALLREIQIYIEVLRTTFSHLEKHRAAARQAAHNLADFAKKGKFWLTLLSALYVSALSLYQRFQPRLNALFKKTHGS
jgi:hypothetical protein